MAANKSHLPTSPQSGDPTVAVALGGGGARGLAHIHIIEALDEMGVRPVAISGSSIGAIMGAAMAAGMRGRDIRDYTLATIGDRKEVAGRLWKLRPDSLKDMMAGGFRIGQFDLERILHTFLPSEIPGNFAELKIPFQIMVTDYYGQHGVLLDEGDLYQAMAASAAIPAVFRPVKINDRVMIDGGIFDPVPFTALKGKADIVIGVDVVGGPEGDIGEIPSRIDSLIGASQLMMQSIIAAKLSQHPPDIFLRPEVFGFHALDFLRAGEVLEKSAPIKDTLKRALEAEIAFRRK